MLKSIDLFAGIGGIRLGFEKAFGDELKTVFVSEWDEYAQKTYKANFHDDFEIAGDITKIKETDIPDFDICLAGFPCQAFSLAGQRKGFKDDYKGMSRGTLFFDVARICAEKKPKVIFCENVKGLTIHDKGRTFEIITETLKEIGYTPFEQILNSRNFGVPQNRERIYIVAFRNDIAPKEFTFPTKTDDTKRIRDIMEENQATSFTGGAVSTCLRPTGLSRRVYTAQISCPAAYSAFRHSAAMSGVPMNRMRISCFLSLRGQPFCPPRCPRRNTRWTA